MKAADEKTSVWYQASDCAWQTHQAFVESLASQVETRSVCEIGGGANPALPIDFVREHGLEYAILDVSATELAKAERGYSKIVADIADCAFRPSHSFDFVFSRMLAEHVRNGEQFHRNVFRLLRPGGVACHFFPTLYAPPFTINRLVPERLSRAILLTLSPGRVDEGKHAKFPAYYSWCRGPTSAQIARFRALGYAVVEYVGFFGHAGYYRRLGLAQNVHIQISRWLLRHPLPLLTSYAFVVLRKPLVGV